MSQFQYVVTNAEGQRYTGTMVAADVETAMKSLVEKDLVVARIVAVSDRPALSRLHKMLGLPERSPMSTDALVAFTQQLVAMLDSGVTVKQALDVMQEDAEDMATRRLLLDMSSRVGAGQSFTDVLAEFPHVFSRQYVATVGAGESAGDLTGALTVMAGLLEKAEALRRKVAAALYYPGFVMAMAVVFMVLMLAMVVPRYAAFYDNMGGELPASTRFVMQLGAFFEAHLVELFLAVCAAVLFVRWAARTRRGRYAFDRAKLDLPVLGSLFRLLAIARFSRTLSSLVGSGVPLMKASEMVAETMDNVVLERAVAQVPEQLLEGRAIVDTLRETGIFTRMSLSMIGVGEQSGRLDDMLGKVATYYEERVDHAVRAMAGLVEPLVILVVGMFVAGLVVALVLPVFNLVTLFVK